MVDFPTRSEFTSRRGPGGVPILGVPKTLSAKEIADLFADLGKLSRRLAAATGLVTGLRQRLAASREIAHGAEQTITSACSFLATLEGAEAHDQREALTAIGDKLREEARRPECVDVPMDPFGGP